MGPLIHQFGKRFDFAATNTVKILLCGSMYMLYDELMVGILKYNFVRR